MEGTIGGGKFTTLRRQLDALHFSQPLCRCGVTGVAMDSVPLVDRLLQNLSRITESFNLLKKENASLGKKVAEATQLQLPLKAENERLVKENNALHMDAIRVKDARQAEMRAQQTATAGIKDRIVDLEFVAEQRGKRAQEAEKEAAGLKERLDSLLAKAPKNQPDFKMSGPVNAEAAFKGRKTGISGGTMLEAAAAPSRGFGPDALKTFSAGLGEREKQIWADSLRDAD